MEKAAKISAEEKAARLRRRAEQVGGASAGGETRPEKEEMLALFSRCSKKVKRFARIE